MPPLRVRIRTIMVAVAVAALFMGVVRLAREYPIVIVVLVAAVVGCCPSVLIMVVPFGIDWLDELRNRASPKREDSEDRGGYPKAADGAA